MRLVLEFAGNAEEQLRRVHGSPFARTGPSVEAMFFQQYR
jgi:hypothetical protein